MDENTWRFAQLTMWLIGIQTTVILAAFGGLWIILGKKLEDIDARFEKLESRFDKVDDRFDKIYEMLMDIDKRVCRIEGSLSAQECCMLKEPKAKKMKKAE